MSEVGRNPSQQRAGTELLNLKSSFAMAPPETGTDGSGEDQSKRALSEAVDDESQQAGAATNSYDEQVNQPARMKPIRNKTFTEPVTSEKTGGSLFSDVLGGSND